MPCGTSGTTASADLPTAGNSIPGSQASAFYLIGPEVRVLIPINDYDLKQKSFTSWAFFANAELKFVGGTRSFHKSIDYKNKFGLFEYSAGIALKNILIYYNRQLFTDNALSDHQRGRVCVSLITQL